MNEENITVPYVFMDDVWEENRPDIEPIRATDGSAAYDLKLNITDTMNSSILIRPQETMLLKTGVRFFMPNGVYALILPRSGLAVKYGITVINSPGLVDNDYQHEIKVALINHGQSAVVFELGNRIAQILFQPFPYNVTIEPWDGDENKIQKTNRTGGFGSTGI